MMINDNQAKAENATSQRPRWTVMIYMAGDNNLTEECIYSLTEMKRVEQGRDLQIFVQYDPKDDFLPVKRYRIRKDTSLAADEIDKVQPNTGEFEFESPKKQPYRRFTNDQKERPGEGFSGDPAALYNFIAYCLNPPSMTAPPQRSDRYFLIICGHGGGILRDYLLRDDSPQGYLTLKELGTVFRNVHRDFVDNNGRPFVFDVFGMDTCLMSMAEIAYELRGTVQVAVGCPSYAPASGWPYREVLEKIKGSCRSASAEPIDPVAAEQCLRDLAKRIVDDYVCFYSEYSFGGLSVTQSALDVRLVSQLIDGKPAMNGKPPMTGLKELAGEFKQKLCQELSSYLRNRKDDLDSPPPSDSRFTTAMILAHWEAQSYNGELYVDLVDFLRILARRYSPLAEKCNRLADFIEEAFVIASRFSGRKFQWTYGLSIYFPWDHVLPYYADAIEFPNHSKWVDFLEVYTRATRRPPRRFRQGKDFDNLVNQNFEEIRMGPDKMGPDKSGTINPIHSMRNPPIVVSSVGVEDCWLQTQSQEPKPPQRKPAKRKPPKR
jgi:hypothetical protein